MLASLIFGALKLLGPGIMSGVESLIAEHRARQAGVTAQRAADLEASQKVSTDAQHDRAAIDSASDDALIDSLSGRAGANK